MTYLTPYDENTRQCTGPSVPAGVETLDEARAILGEPRVAYRAMLIYPDVVITKFIWSVTSVDAPNNTD